MLRTMIRLPDGTQVFSGADCIHAIQSVKLTQCVNDSKELHLGSACANMLEADLQTPNGGLQIRAGDELTVYKVDETGQNHLVGIFITEKPTRPSANMLRITAYDRVTKLDKDLTEWLADLTGWPYSLLTFAGMVCNACGVELANTAIPNGEYPVQKFFAKNITGRKLMQWVGEAAGRFCRARADGKLELAWYEPSAVALTPGGDRFYYQGSLSYEDYEVSPVEKVQIQQTDDDVGVIWPDETGEKNTYRICGNYLLTTTTTDALLPVAKTLYAQMKAVTYTPCKVQLPAGLDIRAGDILPITDRNGKTLTCYVMTKTQNGQRDTLEGTGSHRRDSTSVVHQEKYRAYERRTLELEKQVEGLSVTATHLQTELSGTAAGIQSVYTAVGEITVNAEGIRASVSDLEQIVDGVTDEVQQTKEQIASVHLQADKLEVQVSNITEQGVSKASNTTGTFDERGLMIDNTDSPTKTQVTPDGMTVYRKSYGSTAEVLSATSNGVDATNLHAKTYLIVGGRSRFEDYGADRTGCFWIGG